MGSNDMDDAATQDEEDDDGPPPPIWRLTVLERSAFDFQHLLDIERFSAFFRNMETIEGLLSEQKALSKSVNILYLLTFAGACLVIAGPIGAGARVSLFGVEAPISAIPTQVLALVTAAIYGLFATQFMSLFLLSLMCQAILVKEGSPHWPFFAARFNASNLWAVLIAPRTQGYGSPKRHKFLAWAVLAIAGLTIAAHSIVVAVSSALAFQRALESRNWVLVVFASLAVAITLVSFGALVAAVFWKLPFRWLAGADDAASD